MTEYDLRKLSPEELRVLAEEARSKNPIVRMHPVETMRSQPEARQ